MRSLASGCLTIGLTTVLSATSAWPQSADTTSQVSTGPPSTATPSVLLRPAKLIIHNEPLADALRALSGRAGLEIGFSPSLVARHPGLVSCDCGQSTVGEALDQVLSGTGFGYIESHEQVLIYLEPRSELHGGPPPPGSFFREGRPAVQTGTVRGRISDAETLAPLGSATVELVEPARSIQTLEDGYFVLAGVPEGSHTVMVRRLGFRAESRSITVAAGEATYLEVPLEQQPLELDAIIVTGTAGGTQRRAVGNVVNRVELTEELELRPVASFEEALIAAAPALNLLGNTTDPRGGARIRLRGSSSAALPGDPIILIDGVRMFSEPNPLGYFTAFSRLGDIDPQAIETIEVIKGPAASTLYGSEAANGVIQIVTKRGRVGAAQFDASVEIGDAWAPALNTPDFWIRRADGSLARVNKLDLESQFVHPENPYCCSELRQHGLQQRYSVSSRGGTRAIQYFASYNHNNSEGVWRGSYDVRNSVRGSFFLTALPSLTAALNVGLSWGQLSGGRDDSPAFGDNIFSGQGIAQFSSNPADPRRGWTGSQPDARNPAVYSAITELGRTLASLTVSHSLGDRLTHRLIFGREVVTERESILQRQDDFLATFCCTANRGGTKSIELLNVATHSFDISGSLTTRPVAGLTSVTSYGLQFYNTKRTTIGVEARGFAAPGLTTIGAAGALTSGTEGLLENSTLGLYAQQQLGWQERLFLTAAVRADDSSTFGDEFTGAIYPKLSATWVVSEEPFWRSEQIGQLRLRAAWGAAGRQPDLIAAARLYRPVTGPQGAPAVAPLSIGSPSLGPERGEELEVGFDVDLLGGRLTGSFTRYWRKTKDAILSSPLAPSLGYTVVNTIDDLGSEFFRNQGEISAWGTETTINWRPVSREPVRWDLGFNFATIGNRIESLGDLKRIPVPRTRAHVVGYPLASIFGKVVRSAELVNGTSGAVKNLLCDGGVFVEGKALPMPGGQPVPCSEAPEVYWAPAEPTRLGSIESSITVLDDWQLSLLVDYKGGYWQTAEYLSLASTSYPALPAALLGDDPVANAYLTQIHRNALGRTKADFARLQSVQLSYSVPPNLLTRFGSTQARVSLGMTNVAILWQAQSHVERAPLQDLDSSRPDQIFGGETRGSLQHRQLTLGIHASF